ncbi:MAG: hypothetical protein QOE93_436 [Actinomycetota bacterium]|jgi:plastocyanin|nr:hypothetical protein [Actinomycetota bacterium]
MRKLAILMAVLALFTAACGDDEPTSTSGTTGDGVDAPTPNLPEGTSFHGAAQAKDGMEIELDNFYFGPTVVTATQGQTFKVELVNEGEAPHTFTIDSLAIDVTLAPEQRMEVSITAPSTAGTVPFYCKFHQASAKMQGALVVV